MLADNSLSLNTLRKPKKPAGLSGFTLIEILVAISIIGILVGLGTVVFDNALEKGRDSRRKSDLMAIKAALELYFEDNHRYPDPAGGGSSSDSRTDLWIPELVSGGYIKQLPRDPTQAGIIGNLANLSKQLINKKNVKQKEKQGQVASASDLPMLTFGTYVGTGALGFEPDLNQSQWRSKYTLPYAAGVVVRQKWSRIETSDDAFNWDYLDSAIQILKNAGKKASLRIGAGPFSPDWLRTQKNVKTVCWFNDTGPNTPEGNTVNCFPWMTDATYHAERMEFLAALYDHYHNSGSGHRPDLESTISFVSIPPPSHGLAEEFVRVQTPNHTVYLDSNSDPGTHVPIGAIECGQAMDIASCTDPLAAQVAALSTSTFNGQGYSASALKTTHVNSITGAANAMPTWYIAVMHSKKGGDPIDFVQNVYNAIINNNLLDRAMIGFTWLMPYTDMVAEEKAIYDDVMANFYQAHDGMTGWQHDPEDDTPKVEELLSWCTMGAPIHGLWGEAGGGRWPNPLLDEIFQDPYCGLAPSPTPTPVPTPTASPGVPPAPVLVSPIDGATGVSTDPTLSWGASVGATTYKVQVTTDMSVACNSSWLAVAIINADVTAPATSYAASGLDPNTQYRWHVKAGNGSDYSAWTCRSFTTGTFSTPAPTPDVTPTPAVSSTPAPTPAEGISNYRYEIFDSGRSFILWAKIENDDDPELSGHSGATCNESPPPGYNYCLRNSN